MTLTVEQLPTQLPTAESVTTSQAQSRLEVQDVEPTDTDDGSSDTGNDDSPNNGDDSSDDAKNDGKPEPGRNSFLRPSVL